MRFIKEGQKLCLIEIENSMINYYIVTTVKALVVDHLKLNSNEKF